MLAALASKVTEGQRMLRINVSYAVRFGKGQGNIVLGWHGHVRLVLACGVLPTVVLGRPESRAACSPGFCNRKAAFVLRQDHSPVPRAALWAIQQVCYDSNRSSRAS
eukprot:scaffold584047_cov18-Prasinocladus_malaysianus.AAC.1